jgi:hypothetical protein
MKIRVEKTGSIWHGYLEGHPEIDERGLTKEKALEKVRRIMEARGWKEEPAERRPDSSADEFAS